MPKQASGHSRSGSNSNGRASDTEPHTLDDLNKMSMLNMVPAQNPVKRWCVSAATLFDKAVLARDQNDLDQNYILLMRGVSILIEIIPKHSDYNPNETCYLDVKQKLVAYLDELDSLKKLIKERHTKWEKQQASSSIALSKPPELPKSNAILSPTTLLNRTQNGVVDQQKKAGSVASRVAAFSGGASTPAAVASISSPAPSTIAAAVSPKDASVTDLIAARLKALQPGASSPNTSAAPASSRPLVKQPSSFLDNNNSSGLKISPSNSSISSMQNQSTNNNTAFSSVGMRRENSNNGTNMHLKRESSNGSIVSGTTPPPLMKTSSGSGPGFVMGGNGAGGNPSGRVLMDVKMTAGELYAGLAALSKQPTKVLLFDVRPMEDYIQGHLRWPDAGGKKQGSDFASGLVHIEPDWLHAGVDSEHIVHCLRGFTSPTDPRLMLFDYRHHFNLIVCYDSNSSNVHASPALSSLISALFLSEKSRVLSHQPIVLEGGFEAWVNYLKSKGEHLPNWVEIGEGVGGGCLPIAAPAPVKRPTAPSPSNGISAPAPMQSKPYGGGMVGQGNQYSVPQSQYNGMGGLKDTAGGGYPYAQQQNQHQHQHVGGYLNVFDNPFNNFSTTRVTVNYTGYPLLPHQIQNSLTPAGSPSFSRQSSFGATVPSADYPSLGPLTSSMPVTTGAVPPSIPQKSVAVVPVQPPVTISPKMDTAKLQQAQFQAYLQQQQQQQQQQQFQPPLPPQQQQQQYQQYLAQQQQLPQPPVVPQKPVAQQLPPPTPAKPTGIARKSPPPLPVKPRLSVTSVEFQSSASPAYSNPADFISLSALGSSNIGVVGLKNLGNTCFMNSTLQCLSGTVPLARYFLGGNYRKGINRANPMGTKGVLVEEFAQVIKAMWSGQESIVTPAEFKKRVGEFNEQFKGTEQHDSQEFLTFLLDTIHEDMNIARGVRSKQIDTKSQEDETIPDEIRLQMAWNNYRSTNWSIIVDLFQGQLKSKLECLTCGTTSTTFNTFMYLSVPIPSHNSAGQKGGPVYLDECLDKFVEIETLDGEDAWNCPRCKCKRRTRKTMTIAKLPTILLVHLKRFYYQGPFKSKIDTYVDFPLASMDLGKYLAASGGRSDSNVYDLYAVSNHAGTLGNGHYTATVHNSSKKAWYNFSDTRVGVCDVNELKTNSAYILYYVRKTTATQPPTTTDWWN
ncbi:hypothetical protein CcCBS67573_g00939 [Chytriomyces confervae]|uniref:ubiquitinyl hydrolase 1 n=1 Tax=Chytriomyces confervae TaxID=246404 RepID=A0A507FMX4_9FUNG|nr:hypothetical protein CcCBS67573_g00939 [Chytriomyces confervae]